MYREYVQNIEPQTEGAFGNSHACEPASHSPLSLYNLGWRRGDENINSVRLEEFSRLGEVGGCTEIQVKNVN